MITLIVGNINVSSFVKSATVNGDSTYFYETLSVELHATSNGRTRAFTLVEGEKVTFKWNGTTRFVGVLFKQDRSSDGSLSITCYDPNVYLAKSSTTQVYRNKTATNLAKQIATEYGISVGALANTGYVIPYLLMRQKTLQDVLLTALELTKRQTGRRFFVRSVNGKLTLIEGAKPTKRYVFRADTNLISASYSRSIEDTFTQIKVTGGEKGKETSVTVKDDAKRKKYGVLQYVEALDEKATASQIRQRANTLLKEKSGVSEQMRATVPGIIAFRVGEAVTVVDSMTGISGNFYVTTIDHSFEGTLHTMDLELGRSYDLPDIQIDEEATQR